MKKDALLFLVLVLAVGVAQAQTAYHEVVDVPTVLGGVTYLPWEILLNNGGAYSLPAALPPNTPLDALQRLSTGSWLFSVEAPTLLGGTLWDPRDVFEFDGVSVFTAVLDGAAAGIPATSDVDAAFRDPTTGDLVISFDVPTVLGATAFLPSDLVRVSGGVFSLYLGAAAMGLPLASNVTGADSCGPQTFLTLDVPTPVTGLGTVLPGEVLAWDGTSLTLFDAQLAWPAARGSRVNALDVLDLPGVVPPTISVNLVGPNQLQIDWSPSTCSGAVDYGIYEGVVQLGVFSPPSPAWYNQVQIVCTDAAPFFTETITVAPQPVGVATYYLVVPNNALEEGDYGAPLNPGGGLPPSRPPLVGACRISQFNGCACP